jgi:hypothetical protein
MDLLGQGLTLVAVLLGAGTTYWFNRLGERERTRSALTTRWDAAKLDAYVTYVAAVRDCIHAAGLLHDKRTGAHEFAEDAATLTRDLVDRDSRRGAAFERVMMLAGPEVIRAAHALNRSLVEVDWRAKGGSHGTLEQWRQLNLDAFTALNRFHEAARRDLGVAGDFDSHEHSSLGLNLPSS